MKVRELIDAVLFDTVILKDSQHGCKIIEKFSRENLMDLYDGKYGHYKIDGLTSTAKGELTVYCFEEV